MPTVRVSVRSIHWPGASSDAAVRNMHAHQTRNIGRRGISANISRHATPSVARSVRGKRMPTHIAAETRAGTITSANWPRQPMPKSPAATPTSPPTIRPAGHQAWRMLRRLVLSSG